MIFSGRLTAYPHWYTFIISVCVCVCVCARFQLSNMVEFLFEESWRTVNSILPCSYASWQDDWICSNRIHQTWTLEIVEQPKDIKTKRIPSCIYYPIYIDINIQFMMEKSNGITKMKIRPPVKATKISSHVHSSLSLSLTLYFLGSYR